MFASELPVAKLREMVDPQLDHETYDTLESEGGRGAIEFQYLQGAGDGFYTSLKAGDPLHDSLSDGMSQRAATWPPYGTQAALEPHSARNTQFGTMGPNDHLPIRKYIGPQLSEHTDTSDTSSSSGSSPADSEVLSPLVYSLELPTIDLRRPILLHFTPKRVAVPPPK